MKTILLREESDEDYELLPGAEYMLNGQEQHERLEPLLSDSQEWNEHDEVAERFRERDLIHLIHDNAKKISDREIIKRTDLFFDMFPSFTGRSHLPVWCIPVDHPIHIIMEDFMDRQVYSVIDSRHIDVPIGVWMADDVFDAIDYIMYKIQEKQEIDQKLTVDVKVT